MADGGPLLRGPPSRLRIVYRFGRCSASFDLYLACWCIAGVAIVAGFTLARSTPPIWVLDLLLAGLVLVLAGVIYSNRSRREA